MQMVLLRLEASESMGEAPWPQLGGLDSLRGFRIYREWTGPVTPPPERRSHR